MLRDYHAENVMLVRGREGVQHFGLLDFQDALSGHPAYDLASVLEDARRDVPPEIERTMIDRYVAATGNPDVFERAYWALAAQRNMSPPRLMSPRPTKAGGNSSRSPKIGSSTSTYLPEAMLPSSTTSHSGPTLAHSARAPCSSGRR